MSLSVNTNQPALIALQNLNKTNDDMQGPVCRAAVYDPCTGILGDAMEELIYPRLLLTAAARP